MSFVSLFKYSKNYYVDKYHKKETISKSDYVPIQKEANVNVFLAFIMPNNVM